MPRASGPSREDSPAGSSLAPGSRASPKPRRSCHLCRLRKVKCVTASGSDRCNSCVSLGRECEAPQTRRRPGPVSRYSREAINEAGDRGRQLSTSPRSARPPPGLARASYSPRSVLPRPATGWTDPTTSQPYASTQAAPSGPSQGGSSPLPRSTREAELSFGTFDNQPLGAPPSDIGWHRSSLNSDHGVGPVPHTDHVQTPASHASRSTTTHIEDVVPWATVTRILHSYHAYLYPLMPIVHWPTFVQQLISREDERSRRWRALVFALLAYSIVQLPRPSLEFIDVQELVRLHQRCFSCSRALQNRAFKDIGAIDIATLYCQHIYLSSLFKKNMANVALVEAIRLAQELKIHTDDPKVDCIERELRRRIFWLLYGSDRTICVMDDTPMLIWDWDMPVPYPLAVDDEYLTKAGSFPQPEGRTSALSGFHYVSRIFHVLGVVLSSLRAHRTARHAETSAVGNLLALPAYAPSSHFLQALDCILADLPLELQLRTEPPPLQGSTSPSTSKGRDDGRQRSGNMAFDICRVNIAITQAMTRQLIKQYALAMGEEDAALHPSPRKLVIQMLDSMPTESLTANGDSLRMKVLYFVLSGMRDMADMEQDADLYNSEFLSMYMRLREQQQAHILHEAPHISDASRSQTPAPDGDAAATAAAAAVASVPPDPRPGS